MAGWTNKGLAKGQKAAHPLAAGSSASVLDTCQSLPSALGDALDCSPAADSRRRASRIEARPLHAAPRLVASNTSPDMQLSRIVELEIIPRLMLMHSAQPLRERPPMPALLLNVEHVHTLAQLAVEGATESASSYVRALLDAGASQDHVFLDLLAPCARWMGEQWEADVYDFAQVTIGLWRLQRVLHEYGARFNQVARPDADSHRAMLAAVPGAQHTFGVVMAAEFFSRAGWDIECEPQANWSDLKGRVSRNWFDMFGLSIATGDSIPHVASAILDIREVSANPTLFVMVGGPLAATMPELAQLCGADAMACDADVAVATANSVVSRAAKPR